LISKPCAAKLMRMLWPSSPSVPGIGTWTAEIYAMFSLGRADVFAPGDLALQEAARVLYGLPAPPQSPRRIAASVQRHGALGDRLRRGCSGPTTGSTSKGKGSDDARISRLAARGRIPAIPVRRWCSCTATARTAPICWASPMCWAEHLPDTLFVAPDAPETIPMMPSGLQWFPDPVDRRLFGRGGRARADGGGGRSQRVSRRADGG
jgi:hypothetical protein